MNLLAIIIGSAMVGWGIVLLLRDRLPEPAINKDFPETLNRYSDRFHQSRPYMIFSVMLTVFGIFIVTAGFVL